jgi:uncharacterized small protein (DUF1192 family)
VPTLTRNKFVLEYTETGIFKAESLCLIDDIAQDLDERTTYIVEGLQLPERDNVIRDDIKNALLKHVVTFAANRDARNFNFENAEIHAESPVSESEALYTVALLENKVASLEAEISSLKAQNAVLRGESVEHLRYRPSSRNKPKFDSLKDYVQSIVRAELSDAGIYDA